MKELKLNQERFEELSKMSASKLEKTVKKSELLDFIHDLNVKIEETKREIEVENETPIVDKDNEEDKDKEEVVQEEQQPITEKPGFVDERGEDTKGDDVVPEMVEKFEKLAKSYRFLRLLCAVLAICLLISICA